MKITNTNTIKAYRYHEFESSCYRTPEYVEFEKKYINFFYSMCKNNGWELTDVRKMHFECSIVIKGKNGRYVHILGSDVRLLLVGRSWYDAVCYRYCAGPEDYHGENNRWTNFDELEEKLQNMLNN